MRGNDAAVEAGQRREASSSAPGARLVIVLFLVVILQQRVIHQRILLELQGVGKQGHTQIHFSLMNNPDRVIYPRVISYVNRCLIGSSYAESPVETGHVTFTKPMMSHTHTGLIYDAPHTLCLLVLLWFRLIHWDYSLAPSTGNVLDLYYTFSKNG